MQNLNVSLIQTDIIWESCDDNLNLLNSKFVDIDDNTDLIILPEMFATGFSMNSVKISQGMDGKIVRWMLAKAEEKNSGIFGSVPIFVKDGFRNRLVCAMPDGKLKFYDKKHLFRFIGEDLSYTPGNRRVIVDFCGWKISLFICYDLRFPVWIRNFENDYDIALFVANWPELRFYAWKSLLIARAIENQVFVLGVNRVGLDGNGISYRGDSSIVGPNGNLIVSSVFDESIIRAQLDYKELEKIRVGFPVWKDADVDLMFFC